MKNADGLRSSVLGFRTASHAELRTAAEDVLDDDAGEGYTHRHLWPKEMAVLQTFPPTHKWPVAARKRCLHEIGNAVPPLVARLLVEGAA